MPLTPRGSLQKERLILYLNNIIFEPEALDFSQFTVSEDHKTLFWVCNDKEIQVTAQKAKTSFLSLRTLEQKYG